MTRQSARGHICIRRKAKDGEPGKTGNPGLTIRTTAWETGKEYRNDLTLDVTSVRYLDICLDKNVTVGVSNICVHQDAHIIGEHPAWTYDLLAADEFPGSHRNGPDLDAAAEG